MFPLSTVLQSSVSFQLSYSSSSMSIQGLRSGVSTQVSRLNVSRLNSVASSVLTPTCRLKCLGSTRRLKYLDSRTTLQVSTLRHFDSHAVRPSLLVTASRLITGVSSFSTQYVSSSVYSQAYRLNVSSSTPPYFALVFLSPSLSCSLSPCLSVSLCIRT